MATNSPWSGRSSTVNDHVADGGERAGALEGLRDLRELDDGRLAAPAPRTSPAAGLAVRRRLTPPAVSCAVREQAALEPDRSRSIRKASTPMITRIRMMCSRQAAPLARAEQVAQAVPRVDQLGEHDVAEGQPEEVPQAVVDRRAAPAAPGPCGRPATARAPSVWAVST